MRLWLLGIGFLSMLGQVVLLRELSVAFFGSELIYILSLGVWLLGTAAGAGIGRRAFVPPARQVRLLLAGFACILPLTVVFTRGMRVVFGGTPGAYLPFSQQLLGMALAILPVGLLLGLLFQWAAKLYVGDRKTLAAAYAIECVGGLVGGVAATLFLKWGLQNFTAALLCALCSAAIVLATRRLAPWRGLDGAAASIAAALVVALAMSGGIDRRLTSWNHPRLLATRDTPYSRVTLTETDGQISVYENDALTHETEGTAAEEFVHLAAIQHPLPQSVLVLGGGGEGLLETMLEHHPQRLDYVEMNGPLLELLTRHLPESFDRALEADGVEVAIADPRRFIETDRTYDLILVGMPEPDSGRTTRYYSREFFEQCAARLSPQGLVALRLRGAENLWTPQLIQKVASVHRALQSAFADVVTLPGTTFVTMASNSPLARDSAVLADRLKAREVQGRLVIPEYVRYLYTNDRFFEINRLLLAAQAPVNTDLRPSCYQFTLLIWLSKFFPDLMAVELPALDPRALSRQPAYWLGAVAALGVLLLCRRWSIARRSLLAAVAGLVGMVLEGILILHYQTVNGVLFQDLGLLLTAFMAGLGLGSAAIDRVFRFQAAWRPRSAFLAGAIMIVEFAALTLLTALLLWSGAIQSLASTAALLLACGFMVAALFAYASLRGRPEQRRVIAPLYAADLLGGSIGSLAASLLLIPMLGLFGSALAMVCVVLAALLLI